LDKRSPERSPTVLATMTVLQILLSLGSGGLVVCRWASSVAAARFWPCH